MNQGNSDDRRSQQPSSLPLSLHASLLTPSQPPPSPPEEPRETRDSPTHSDDSYESDSAHHQERQDRQDLQHEYDTLDRSHYPHPVRNHSFPQAIRTSSDQDARIARHRPITTPLPEDHARRSHQVSRDHYLPHYSLPGPSHLLPRDSYVPGSLSSYADIPNNPVSYHYSASSSLATSLPPLDRRGLPSRFYNEPGPSRYYDQEPHSLPNDLDSPSGSPHYVSSERTGMRGRTHFAPSPTIRGRAPLDSNNARTRSLPPPHDPRSFDVHPSSADEFDSLTHHRRNPQSVRLEHYDGSEPSFRPTPTPVSHVGDSVRLLPPPTQYARHEGGTGRDLTVLPPPIPPPPISGISSLPSVSSSGELIRQYPDSSDFSRPSAPGVFRTDLPRLDSRPRPPPLETPLQLPPLRAGFPISPEGPLMPLGHYEPIPSGPVELPPFSYGGELAPHVPQDDAPIAGPSEPSTSATTLDVDVDADPPPLTPARGRGSRGGRGVRGGKRKRTTKPSVAEPEKDDGDGEDVPVGEQPGSPNDSRSEDDDDPLSDKPLRRAPKKVAIACDFCRGRKLKCNGVRPQCSNCARRERPCSYVPFQRRRGPGKKPQKSSLHGSTQDTGSQHLLGEPSTARSTAPGSPNPPPPPPSSSAPESSLSPPAGPVAMMPTEYVFSSTYPPLGLTPLQREEARRRVAGERPLGASSIASSSRDPGEEEGGPSSMDFDEYIREDYAEAKPPPRPPEGRKR